MKHSIVDRYTYRVVWSEEDGEFVGLCAEFPSLSHLDADRGEALNGIVELISGVVQDMTANEEPLPEPLTEKKYSGELRLRMPPALHQRLAIQAAEEHTSLNAVIVRRLLTY